MRNSCLRLLNQKLDIGEKKGKDKVADKVSRNLIEIASTHPDGLGLQAAKLVLPQLHRDPGSADVDEEPKGDAILPDLSSKTEEELDADLKVLEAEIKHLQGVLDSVPPGNP